MQIYFRLKYSSKTISHAHLALLASPPYIVRALANTTSQNDTIAGGNLGQDQVTLIVLNIVG